MISLPAHLGGFIYAFTKITPHGWEYEGHTGEKGGGPLLPRPGVAHDPRFEAREDYIARSRRTLRISLAVLEVPSVAALEPSRFGPSGSGRTSRARRSRLN